MIPRNPKSRPSLDRTCTALALSIVLSLPLPASAGKLYRWIDEQGVVHFTDTPPPDAQATPLNRRPATGYSPERPDDALQPWQEREKAFQERREQIQSEREKARQEAERTRAVGEQCDRLARQIRALESGVRMSRPGEQGERVFMSDAERAAELERSRARQREHCRN